MPRIKIAYTLYGTTEHPRCDEARAFLEAHGVDYVFRDIVRDGIALRDLLYMHANPDIPALVAGYRSAVGFDPEAWLEVLAHGREIEATGDPLALPEDLGDDPIKL